MKNRFMDMGRGEERVRCMETVTWKLTICKIDSQWEFAIWLRKLKQGLHIEAAVGGENGREVQKGGIYVYLLGSSDSKASAYNEGDPGSIPGSGRFPGEGHGNPLQYSCFENPMD